MSPLFAALFSLGWGAIVWLAVAAVSRGRLSRHCSPAFCLAAILAVALPSSLALTGLTMPVPAARSVAAAAAAGAPTLDAIAASLEPIMAPSRGEGAGWLPGLLLAAYAAGALLHLASTVRAWRSLADCARDASPLAGHAARWPVLATARPVAPFAIGGRNAAIVLPDALVRAWPAERVAMVVAHEEAHLRHRDPTVALGLAVLVALFWFNPFLRGLVARWRNACELRADAAVLRGAPGETRKSYARALVDTLRFAAGPRHALPSTSFFPRGSRSEKMRIAAIMSGFEFAGKGPARLAAHAAIAGLLLVGGGSALAAATAAGSVRTLETFIPGARVTSPYGVRRKFQNLKMHTGVDVRAAKGAPIASPGDAEVMQATDLFRAEPRWGKAVVLKFDGELVVWFTHLDSYSVRPGDRVREGEVFATVGRTGQAINPHIHVEAYRRGARVDPATVWDFLKL